MGANLNNFDPALKDQQGRTKMGMGKMLGKVANRFLTGKSDTSGPKDGPMLQRQDSLIGMAMKGVMKLKKRSQARAAVKKQDFGSAGLD